jgi:hypothetical protein
MDELVALVLLVEVMELAATVAATTLPSSNFLSKKS